MYVNPTSLSSTCHIIFLIAFEAHYKSIKFFEGNIFKFSSILNVSGLYMRTMDFELSDFNHKVLFMYKMNRS